MLFEVVKNTTFDVPHQMNIQAISFLTALMLTGVFTNGQTASPKTEDEPVKRTKTETKFTEVVGTDSVSADELLKRAMKWIKAESNTYKKSGGSTAGSKAECEVAFPVKPKELNPQVDYTGKIVMKVVIECKPSKYRYTISDIRHVSKSGRTDGGNIDNIYPDCGSQTMNDIVWKKLRSEALKNASGLVAEVKEGMSKDAKEAAKDDW
jgi:hypothetical protein